MIVTFEHNGESYKANLDKPVDISMPLRADEKAASAWYVSPVRIEPVRMGDWIGDVKQGGSVNFRNITFNPHGNGTHTECVGHISKENYTINQCLKKFFFITELVSVTPEKQQEDFVITAEQLKKALENKQPEALIIRTLPNSDEKLTRQYSNTNPPYLEEAAAKYIHQKNIQHLLIDLPSVDREQDNGKLTAHHIFWQYPKNTLVQKTITELVYVPSSVADGRYLLNLQIAGIESDAAPSKPLLFKLF